MTLYIGHVISKIEGVTGLSPKDRRWSDSVLIRSKLYPAAGGSETSMLHSG